MKYNFIKYGKKQKHNGRCEFKKQIYNHNARKGEGEQSKEEKKKKVRGEKYKRRIKRGEEKS